MPDIAPTASAPAAPSTPAPAAPSSEPAAKAPPSPAPERRKYSLKVDGEARDLELTDDEISVRLQKAEAAEKRMSEAAQVRKSFAEAVAAIKKDPFAALKDPVFGVDLKKLAEQRLIEEYQLELMTPEARAQKERELEIERLKKEAADHKAALEAERQRQLDDRTFQETEAKFIRALSDAGMEKSYEALYEMARIADLALENGIEYSEKQLVQLVQESLDGQRSKLENKVRAGLKGEKLLSHLGEDTVREVLRASVEKMRAAPQVEEKPATVGDLDDEPRSGRRQNRAVKEAKKMMGYRDAWRDMLRG